MRNPPAITGPVARHTDEPSAPRLRLVAAPASQTRTRGYSSVRLAEILGDERLTTLGDGQPVGETVRMLLQGLGELATANGRHREAEAWFDAALVLATQLDNTVEAATTLSCVGQVALAEDRLDDAQCLFETARATAVGFPPVECLLGTAELAIARGNIEEAGSILDEVLRLARRSANQRHLASTLFALGLLERALGNLAAAAVHHSRALEIRDSVGDESGVAQSLEALAGLEVCGDPERCARILGAAESVRAVGDFARPPSRQPEYKRAVAAVRAALAPDVFNSAWARGANLSVHEAVALALGHRGRRLGRPTEGWESLTRAESLVSLLAAEGLTNPEIAERLFISRNTVKSHLRKVFSKLGAASRVELARMAEGRAR